MVLLFAEKEYVCADNVMPLYRQIIGRKWWYGFMSSLRAAFLFGVSLYDYCSMMFSIV